MQEMDEKNTSFLEGENGMGINITDDSQNPQKF